MSVIALSDAKSYLDVIHNGDDFKLQLLLDSAEDEARQFMNRDDMTLWDSDYDCVDMPGSVKIGVMLLLQATYQASPDDAEKLRKAAEVKLMPFRESIGC